MFLKSSFSPGAPLRSLPPQHGGVRPGQGARPQEPADDPPPGQADVGAAPLRAEPAQGQGDGAADQDQAGAEGVRLQGRGGVPEVSERAHAQTDTIPWR